MTEQTRYQQFRQKADQYFAKKNYVLANNEYARAQQLAPSDEIAARIRFCEEQIALQMRKEWIKKGRRLEKKGDLVAAAEYFSRAFESQPEAWLEKKIEQLGRRDQAARAESLVERIRGMAESESPAAKLAICEQALELGQDDRLRQQKLACLVQLGRYTEAIGFFEERAVDDDQGRYDYGYALIATGHYRRGLDQWAGLPSAHPVLIQQIEVCLPRLMRELDSDGGGHALPYRLLAGLPAGERNPVLERYRRYCTCRYAVELRDAGEHARLGELLPELPAATTPALVGLLAKLYFSLAEGDVRWLEPAISYWLTAIYNDELLQSLRIHRAVSDAPDNRALRAGLLQLLQERVDDHARAGRLSPALDAHWQAERQQIELLAALPIDAGGLAVFPCTPAFARDLALSEPILDLLREQGPGPEIDEQDWLALSAHYAPGGRDLVWIEAGSEDRVFNALPPAGTDPLTDYLRQRIALGCGISRVRAGERQTRKFFQAALPLLESTPQFRRQLIDLAYSEPPEKVVSSLAEAMGSLSRHLSEADFLQAAAHVIAGDAESLMRHGVNPAALGKRVKKALAICPDSAQARSLLTEIRREETFQRLGKAFKGGDLNKVAFIVRESADLEVRRYFFDIMDRWRRELTVTDKDERIAVLRPMYGGCLIVDKEHPTTIDLAGDLRRLEAS